MSTNLPQCIHRGANLGGERWECTTDRLVMPKGYVTESVCHVCPYVDMPKIQDEGLGDTVHRVLHNTGLSKLKAAMVAVSGGCGCKNRRDWLNDRFPFKGRKHRKFNGEWSVLITAAPRSDPKLLETVASCVRNNWTPWIFAEPNTDTTGLDHFTVTRRDERLGAWFNWLDACRSILQERPTGWILTVQDDTEFVDGAREWFEANPAPDGIGMASLYTSRKYHRKDRRGWHRVHTKSLWGACAMAFPAEVLAELVEHPMAKKWRGAPFKTRKRAREDWEVGNVDTAVSKILRAMGKEMWFTTPSLSQHIADHSAMGHGGRSGNREAEEVGLP